MCISTCTWCCVCLHLRTSGCTRLSWNVVLQLSWNSKLHKSFADIQHQKRDIIGENFQENFLNIEASDMEDSARFWKIRQGHSRAALEGRIPSRPGHLEWLGEIQSRIAVYQVDKKEGIYKVVISCIHVMYIHMMITFIIYDDIFICVCYLYISNRSNPSSWWMCFASISFSQKMMCMICILRVRFNNPDSLNLNLSR